MIYHQATPHTFLFLSFSFFFFSFKAHISSFPETYYEVIKFSLAKAKSYISRGILNHPPINLTLSLIISLRQDSCPHFFLVFFHNLRFQESNTTHMESGPQKVNIVGSPGNARDSGTDCPMTLTVPSFPAPS